MEEEEPSTCQPSREIQTVAGMVWTVNSGSWVWLELLLQNLADEAHATTNIHLLATSSPSFILKLEVARVWRRE